MDAPHELPDTRVAITHRFQIDGVKCYVNVGFSPEGKPMEIFITVSKEGSTLAGFADSFSRAVSIALQYGVPMAVFIEKLSGQRFEPLGLTTDRQIPEAESIIDYVFRWIAGNCKVT